VQGKRIGGQRVLGQLAARAPVTDYDRHRHQAVARLPGCC
jgi:hypothetical protein